MSVLKPKCRRRRCQLLSSITYATRLVDDFAADMYSDQHQWQRAVLGHNFNMIRGNCSENGAVASSLVHGVRSWLGTHEDAQVMLGSVMVVVGIWWLARAVLSLVLNLVCPLLVVLFAVICVPQLRDPLIGQNYPKLANLIRNILLKLAENIRTEDVLK